MIYLIPAYKEKIKDRKEYSQLIRGAKKFGKVKFLDLQLENSLYDLCIEAIYANNFTCKDTIIGFSMGALIAYEITTLYPFKKLICNSLSPCLGGDLMKVPPKERKGLPVEELNATKYEKSLADETIFIIGKKEHPFMQRRSRLLARKNKGRFIVEGGDHELFVDKILKLL